MLSPLRVTGIFLLLFAPAGAPALTVVPLPVPRPVAEGYPTVYSPAVVDGHPAVAWAFDESKTLSFVRAADAAGLAWGASTVVVAGSLPVRDKVCLRSVNGKPAICYHDGNFKVVRALDTAGTAWSPPVTVETPDIPAWAAVSHFSMEVVDGKPAIVASLTRKTGQLVFIRALDADGTSWGPMVTVAERDSISSCSLKIVEGRPAIAWGGNGGMWYVRATESAGSAWGTPVLTTPAGDAPGFVSMEIVNGHPAIGYVTKYEDPAYVRALDAAGTAWGEPAYAGVTAEQAWSMSVATANGRPCMAWYSTYPEGVRFAQAKDDDGIAYATWKAAVTVEGRENNTGYPALFTAGGRPAVVYVHYTRGLQYLRAADAAGSSWVPPVLQVQGPSGFIIPDGGGAAYGVVAVGTEAGMAFTLTNTVPGPSELLISGITIDGPDAAEFSVVPPPPASVLPNAPVTLTVTCAPVKPGLKSASLHIASDSGGALHFHDINLTANAAPDIAVERHPGTALEDGGALVFPFVPPGTVSDIIVTVRNPGGAELNGLALTLDGPDHGNFSIVTQPAAAVAPGGFTAFTVRLTQTPGGSKTAALHIASNLTGSKNPFDLTVQSATGLTDSSFHPSTPLVLSMVVQPDRRILIGGRGFLKRLLPDGAADPLFFVPLMDDGNGAVRSLVVQDDAKILLGGTFTSVGGRARAGMARLLPDGSLDESFAPDPGDVRCLAVQPDGKILCGGFRSQGSPSSLIRLHADGSRDQGFAAVSVMGTSDCVALLEDGRVLAGGAVPALTRLEADGSASSDFQLTFQGQLYALAVSPNGRFLSGGPFGSVRRYFPDGSADPSVTFSPLGWVFDLAVQADGKSLICAGRASEPGQPVNASRLNAGGSRDHAFNPEGQALSGAPGNRLVLEANGTVLLAKYSQFDNDTEGNLIRLLNDPAVTLLTKEGTSTVRWLRSGSVPEVSSVTFDVNLPGSPDWTRMGRGTRVTGGWELHGLTLPSLCQIRARGRAGGSLLEEIKRFPSALAWWRLQSFNTPDNTGDAADDADPDHDGLTNFTEFAFGLDPVDRTSSALPEFKYDGGSLTSTFTAPEGSEDVVYGAEWSATMLPGTWTDIPDTGVAGGHVFRASAGAGKVFVRFVVWLR